MPWGEGALPLGQAKPSGCSCEVVLLVLLVAYMEVFSGGTSLRTESSITLDMDRRAAELWLWMALSTDMLIICCDDMTGREDEEDDDEGILPFPSPIRLLSISLLI